jgi:LacI family transcriptional regulator
MRLRQGRAISIDDVARMCDLSTTTVSRVLNEKGEVSPATRARIKKTISKLGYVPSGAARTLGSARPHDRIRTQTVAIVCSRATLRSVYGAELLAVLSDLSLGNGYRMAVELDDAERRLQYDGVIITESAQVLQGADTPCVTVGWLSEDPLVAGVMPDWEEGTYTALKVALSRGYRRPLLLTGSRTGPDRSFDAMLFRGGERALREEGIDTTGLVFQESVHTKTRAYEVAREVLRGDAPPDLIVSNDEAALGVYRAAAELDVAIPGDLGVIGCDGVSLCSYLSPSLSTISVDFERLAEEVLRRLVPAMNRNSGPAPHKLVMPVRLVEGHSIRGRGQ